jgi:hypothetical protein
MAMKEGALVKVEEIERDRDQLWAEAAILERNYGPLLELPSEIIPVAAAEQEKRRAKEPQESDLDERVAEVPEGFISEDEIWACMGLGANMNNPTAKVKRNKQHVAIRNKVMKSMVSLGVGPAGHATISAASSKAKWKLNTSSTNPQIALL